MAWFWSSPSYIYGPYALVTSELMYKCFVFCWYTCIVSFAVRTRTESSISKKVWRDHKEQMKSSLSVAIFPFLVKDSLIPGTDRLKYVDPKTTEVKKLDIIIGSVPRSGHPDYVLKFIKCLRDSSQEAGQAHEQLADLLEVAYNKHKENGTRWSISQTVTTSWDLGKRVTV